MSLLGGSQAFDTLFLAQCLAVAGKHLRPQELLRRVHAGETRPAPRTMSGQTRRKPRCNPGIDPGTAALQEIDVPGLGAGHDHTPG